VNSHASFGLSEVGDWHASSHFNAKFQGVLCQHLLKSFKGGQASGRGGALYEILLVGEVDLVGIEHDAGEVASKTRCWGDVFVCCCNSKPGFVGAIHASDDSRTSFSIPRR
jgi:hypothetical protein